MWDMPTDIDSMQAWQLHTYFHLTQTHLNNDVATGLVL
jgi:hypothetical protein